MNETDARTLINVVLQEQLAQGGLIHTQNDLENKYMETRIQAYLKSQCDIGGIIHNLVMNKPKDHHDGIRGVAKMMMNKGDKLLPEKFDNEVRTGVLFRHWSAEMRQYLNVIDKDMLVLMNIAEKDIESKLEVNSLKSSVKKYVEKQNHLDDGDSDKDKFFITEFKNKYEGNQDKMVDNIIQVLNEQLHTCLMMSLNGEA